MELSKDTKHIIEFLDYTSGNTLRKRNDLGIILEILASNNQSQIANELIFYGSALWNSANLMKVQKDVNSSKLETEIKSLFGVISKLICHTIELCTEISIKERFKKIYLGETTGCQLNLIDLSYDLNELKKVQLKMKKGK